MGFKKIILAILMAIALIACSSKHDSTAPKALAQGGIDSSGGDLTQSTEEEFQHALRNSVNNLRTAYWRLAEIFVANSAKGLPVRDKRYGDMISWFALETGSTAVSFSDVFTKENQQKIQAIISNLKINLQNTECSSNRGDTDASVDKNNEVCLNKKAMMNLPPESIELNLTALLGHEVGHILGFDEQQAGILQESLKSFPSVTKSDSVGVYKIRNAFKNRSFQILNLADSMFYLIDQKTIPSKLCDSDPLKIASGLSPFSQSVNFFSEYILETGYEKETSKLLGSLSSEQSPYIYLVNYCNSLGTNHQPSINKAKQQLFKNVRQIIKQLLDTQKQLLELENKHAARMYPAPYLSGFSPMDLITRERISYWLKIPVVITPNIEKIECDVTIEGQKQKFELSNGDKKSFSVKTNNNIGAELNITTNSYRLNDNQSMLLVDVQVFSSKLNNFWWMDTKESTNVSVDLDHTYSVLIPGQVDSFKIQGNWVHQLNYSQLETISEDIIVECSSYN